MNLKAKALGRQRQEKDSVLWCGRIICILSIMYFNKTLIGKAGSTGRSTRQEVEVGQGEQEKARKQEAPSAIPAQTTEEAACNLPS